MINEENNKHVFEEGQLFGKLSHWCPFICSYKAQNKSCLTLIKFHLKCRPALHSVLCVRLFVLWFAAHALHHRPSSSSYFPAFYFYRRKEKGLKCYGYGCTTSQKFVCTMHTYIEEDTFPCILYSLQTQQLKWNFS